MTELFEKIKKFVDESFKHNEGQLLHFDRTVYWLQKMKPSADEAFLIAAYAHDIERAFRAPEKDYDKTGKTFTDPELLKHHQEEGARIIGNFLEKTERMNH